MKKGQYVIVRSSGSGVLFGKYVSHTDTGTVSLEEARQMWKWRTPKGGTLLDAAKFGVVSAKCKFSVAAGNYTVIGACGIAECTDEAAKSIIETEGAPWR